MPKEDGQKAVKGIKGMLRAVGSAALGVAIIFFALFLYNLRTAAEWVERMYLSHLITEEKNAAAKFGNGSESDDASAIHEQRLRLEVKWDQAISHEDAAELGWTYPPAAWNGHNWTCSDGLEPYLIEAAKKAGDDQPVRCMSSRQAQEALSAAEKGKQTINDAEVAENSRILSKCEALPQQLWDACISLVTNYRITKPEALCRQTSGAIDYNTCMQNFLVAGVTEACAAMVHDPDLAPACQNVKRQHR